MIDESGFSIVIKPTDNITTFDGVRVRLWEGVTSDGVPCKVFIHRVAVHESADASAFEARLAEMIPPGRLLPLSMIL